MFPQASLRSRTVGFPESGSDLGMAISVFPPLWKLKCGLTYTPHSGGLLTRWFSSTVAPDFSVRRDSTAKCPEPLCQTAGVTVLSGLCLP
jgi:hypothetical protein